MRRRTEPKCLGVPVRLSGGIELILPEMRNGVWLGLWGVSREPCSDQAQTHLRCWSILVLLQGGKCGEEFFPKRGGFSAKGLAFG